MGNVAKHSMEAVASARDYATTRPWRGSVTERQAGLQSFHSELCEAYNVSPSLALAPDMTKKTGESVGSYCEDTDTISLSGSFSILTYLVYFATALQLERKGEVAESYPGRWAKGLFSKGFPASYAALTERDAPILERYA